MQPRGQLWFALEGICRDFRSFSGLSEQEALKVLIVVLTNMLAEQKAELANLLAAGGTTSPNEDASLPNDRTAND